MILVDTGVLIDFLRTKEPKLKRLFQTEPGAVYPKEVPMSAIHIHKNLESETLYLPELKPLIGKTVEIIIREEQAPSNKEGKSPYEDFFSLAGTEAVDPEAFKALRKASLP